MVTMEFWLTCLFTSLCNLSALTHSMQLPHNARTLHLWTPAHYTLLPPETREGLAGTTNSKLGLSLRTPTQKTYQLASLFFPCDTLTHRDLWEFLHWIASDGQNNNVECVFCLGFTHRQILQTQYMQYNGAWSSLILCFAHAHRSWRSSSTVIRHKNTFIYK